jgi:hypothetical protein
MSYSFWIFAPTLAPATVNGPADAPVDDRTEPAGTAKEVDKRSQKRGYQSVSLVSRGDPDDLVDRRDPLKDFVEARPAKR